jgi:hypothetical protein
MFADEEVEPWWYNYWTNFATETELTNAFPNGTYRFVAVYDNGSTSEVSIACAVDFPPMPSISHPTNGMTIAPGDRRVFMEVVGNPSDIDHLYYAVRRASDWAWVDGGNFPAWQNAFELNNPLMSETQHRYWVSYDKDISSDCFCRCARVILVDTDPAIILPHSIVDGHFVFSNRNTLNWFDPVPADAYTFAMTSTDGTFVAIADFPTNFASPFRVSVNAAEVGWFTSGERCALTNVNPEGVTNFIVSHIFPLTDAEDPLAFPIQIEFGQQTASFTMTPTGVTEVVQQFSDWQNRNFSEAEITNPAVSGMRVDYDNDGHSTWQEFLADSAATNRLSCLHIASISISSNQVTVISTPTTTNRYYRLARSTNLTTGVWTTEGAFVSGQGDQTFMSATNSADKGFFRVLSTIDFFRE